MSEDVIDNPYFSRPAYDHAVPVSASSTAPGSNQLTSSTASRLSSVTHSVVSYDPSLHGHLDSVADEPVMEAEDADEDRHTPLMLLPPELRNDIYEDVLRGYRCTYGPGYWLHFSSKGNAQLDRPYPPLLLTSKQIRAESLPMFFAMNEFRIFMNIKQLSRVQRWLSCLEEDDMSTFKRTSPLGCAALYITNCSWSDVEHLLPLAEFARNYHVPQIRLADGSRRGRKGGKRHIRKALQEIVSLGRKARKENRSLDWLKERFAQWSRRTFNKPFASTALERASLKRVADAKAASEKGLIAVEGSKEVVALGGPVSDGPRQMRALKGRV